MKTAIFVTFLISGLFFSTLSAADANHQGAALYKKYCHKCHGDKGKGDGPGTRLIKQKVGDLSSQEAMAEYSDEFLFKWVAEGGPAVEKSKLMEPYKDRMKPDEINALIAFIKTLQE